MIFEYSMVSDSLSVTNFELGQVHHALSILDRGIRRDIESLNTEIDRAREQNRNYDSDRDCDDHATLCDLGRYQNYFGIVMSYAVFERFLMDVFNCSRIEIDNAYGEDEKSPPFREYVKCLNRLGIDISQPPFDFDALMRFKSLRNTIMHHGGSTKGAWRDGQYRPGDEIRLDEAYVVDCVNLVGRTCALIAERYEVLARASRLPPLPDDELPFRSA